MGFLRVIRKWALRDKMPMREIARRTGVSRNTIKKYLRAWIVEPEFRTPDRPSKLDPYVDKLSGWLVASLHKSRKERRTAKQMHADPVQLGFDGSYERVAAFVRDWNGRGQRREHVLRAFAQLLRGGGLSKRQRRGVRDKECFEIGHERSLGQPERGKVRLGHARDQGRHNICRIPVIDPSQTAKKFIPSQGPVSRGASGIGRTAPYRSQSVASAPRGA
jgi:transposase